MAMELVSLDFETFYSREYSLKRMPTEAYVRDPRFEALMVGIKRNTAPTYIVEGPDIYDALSDLNLPKCAVLAHHAAFDGFILGQKYNIRPKVWYDTVSMGRPFHGKTIGVSLDALTKHYGLGNKGNEVVNAIGKRRIDFTPYEWDAYKGYCAKDVDLTHALLLRLAPMMSGSELTLIDQMIRMFTEPVLMLDEPLLQRHLAEVIEAKDALIRSVTPSGSLEDAKAVLGSGEKFADLLRLEGVIAPTKVSEKTGKEIYAFAKTDMEFKALEGHPNPRVQGLVAARLGVKSTQEEARVMRLIDVANRGVMGTGTLPIMLNYYGAHTGRASGGEKLNLQNLPHKGALRSSIIAPPGYKLIVGDLSQIEVRISAHVAGQESMLEAFRNKRDIYSEYATGLFGKPVSKSDETERKVGKTSVLGLGYGMGAAGFQIALEQVGIIYDELQAKNGVNYYRKEAYPMIPKMWYRFEDVLRSMIRGESGTINAYLSYTPNGIRLPNGLVIEYPNLRYGEGGDMIYTKTMKATRLAARQMRDGEVSYAYWDRIYGAKLVENIIQALARIVITDQMTLIGREFKVAFQVHDEIISVVRNEDVQAGMERIEELMCYAPPWAQGCPIACELNFGSNYAEAK